jgi:hypothetical protein
MFIDPKLSRATNRYVRESAEDKNPVFRRTVPGLVEVNGAILRYSTTTGDEK